MSDRNIFGIENAHDLFGVIVKRYREFEKLPNEADFLFLCFALYHLREWVVHGEKRKIIKKIFPENRTKEQNFFIEIFDLNEFQTIRDFCNTGKHFSIERGLFPVTQKTSGNAVGVFRAGDSLASDRAIFLINKKDCRDLFASIIGKYNQVLND
tara:strand:- start:1712 stop:2173 length:462 start_codon:yes stop_codon:yes gene_type:complete